MTLQYQNAKRSSIMLLLPSKHAKTLKLTDVLHHYRSISSSDLLCPKTITETAAPSFAFTCRYQLTPDAERKEMIRVEKRTEMRRKIAPDGWWLTEEREVQLQFSICTSSRVEKRVCVTGVMKTNATGLASYRAQIFFFRVGGRHYEVDSLGISWLPREKLTPLGKVNFLGKSWLPQKKFTSLKKLTSSGIFDFLGKRWLPREKLTPSGKVDSPRESWLP